MKKLLRIVLVGSIIMFFYSCYYNDILEFDVPIDQIVSFENDVQPIFTANCIGCHNGTIANPDLRQGNSLSALVPEYVTAFDADNSILYNKLPGIGHPIDAGFILSDLDIAFIETWINQGAEDN